MMDGQYALYAWGNFIHETELDRLPEFADPGLLRGDRLLDDDRLTVYEVPLAIDVSRSLFDTPAGYVTGRDLTTLPERWRVGYLRLATDGTLDDAVRVIGQFEENDVELDRDDRPGRNPLPLGDVVTTWEDLHGQWDLAVVRLPR
ncbi:hypothetical protein [Catellatospora vulcania]|uniref:hypothetical protein n=1 Tax=Catellatospora vulcania TaxID=1460450 RepID=UPI0012D3DE94|nr:hypothetical protein [Catellatospora vulcania]